MEKYVYNSLIAFFGGLFGASIIFIVFYLINAANIEITTPLTFWGIFFSILFINSFIEEGTKFLLIKIDIG